MVKPRGRKPPSSPRRLPGAERREAVLKAALPLFAVRGEHGTTTRELAAAAGVTEPVLYRHFASKEALFEAVLARARDRVLDRLSDAVSNVHGVPARLNALGERLQPILAECEDEFRVLNGAAATHADERMAALVRGAYARFGEFLSSAVAGSGLRRGVDAETAGHLLLEVGLGAALTRPLAVPGVARPDYGPAAMRILLRAIARPR